MALRHFVLDSQHILAGHNSPFRCRDFPGIGGLERQIWTILCPNVSAFAGPIPSTASSSSRVAGRAWTIARNVRSPKTKKAGRPSFFASPSRHARSCFSSSGSCGEGGRAIVAPAFRPAFAGGVFLLGDLCRFGLAGSRSSALSVRRSSTGVRSFSL